MHGNPSEPRPTLHGEGAGFWLAGFTLLIVLPLLNVLPSEDSWLHVSDFALNRFGKFLAFAILALGLDLIWGYTGILSLGHGVFFGLGAYCMGMNLMLAIGADINVPGVFHRSSLNVIR